MTGIIVGRATPPIDWTGVARRVRRKFEGEVSAVVRSLDEANSLVEFYGDARFMPLLPILIVRPDSGTVQILVGGGYAEAAELRDDAVTVWEQTTQRLAENGGSLFDFDALREKHGLMRREEVDAATRNAIADRIARHRRNGVTDKARDPLRDTYARKTFSRYSKHRSSK